jgi:hypothetical protein
MKGKFEFLIEICETVSRDLHKDDEKTTVSCHIHMQPHAAQDKTFVVEQLNIHTWHL